MGDFVQPKIMAAAIPAYGVEDVVSTDGLPEHRYLRNGGIW